MISQISENVRMEKKLDIQEKVIQSIQEKLKDKISLENQEVIKDRDRLVEEVRTISRENEDKASLLKTIDDEYQKVKIKLEELELESNKEEAIVLTNKSSLDTKNIP